MESDSSTQSDSEDESSMIGWMDLGFSEPNSSNASADLLGHVDRSIRGNVVFGIQTLEGINLGDIHADNTRIHAQILEASNAITDFLEGLMSNRPWAVEQLSFFALLVHPSFLRILFGHRKVFHRIAARAVLPGTFASTIVCWVDALLAKIADVTMLLACGCSLRQSASESLNAHQENNGLRAASQLPNEWIKVPSTMCSNHTSPAAKRLAMQLTFAVFIISPRLMNMNIWRESHNVRASELLQIMDDYILTLTSSNEFMAPFSCDIIGQQTRLTYAMTITLFAVLDTEVHRIAPDSPLRPRTMSSLLNMIHHIFPPSDLAEGAFDITPVTKLDPAQTLLIQSYDTVHWFWETFNDSRVAGSECVTSLTSTWLFHLEYRDVTDSASYAQTFSPLEKNPSIAGQAIMKILSQSMRIMLAEQSLSQIAFSTVLSKSCQALIHLQRYTVLRAEPLLVDVQSLGHSLLGILALLLGDLDTQRFGPAIDFLECLTLLDKDKIESALVMTCEDPQIRFIERVDELVLQSRRCTTQKVDQIDLTNAECEKFRIVLSFLTVIWHGKGKQSFHGRSFVLLLSSLIDTLLNRRMSVQAFNHLRDSVITAYSMLDDESRSKMVNKQDAIWRLSMNAGCSNLTVASSFAHHLMHTDRLSDSLCCAEAWEYMQDALSLIMRHHFIGEEEPMALLVSRFLCRGLIRLILAQDVAAVHFVLCSPWTMGFCSNLKSLLHGDTLTFKSPYHGILKSQLTLDGKILLELIGSRLCPDTCLNAIVPNIRSRLMFRGSCSSYSLLLVPADTT